MDHQLILPFGLPIADRRYAACSTCARLRSSPSKGSASACILGRALAAEASASWGVAAAAVEEEEVVVVAVEEEEKLCPWVRRSRWGRCWPRGARAQVMIWTATIPKGRPSWRACGGIRGLFS